jgi:drug/metabolite transporter (DMT)-like permease
MQPPLVRRGIQTGGAPYAVYIVFGKLVLAALFWGGTFVAGRILAQALPPLISATGRFWVAAVLLLFVAWKIEGGLPRLNRSQMLSTFLLGASGIFVYNICFFEALFYLPASRTALLVSLNPIVTALLAAVFLHERLRLQQWLGIAVAFCGAGIVITQGDLTGIFHDLTGKAGWGEALMAGAVLSWSTYTVTGRIALKGLTPIAATTYATLWGTSLLTVTALLTAPPADISKLTWEAYLSIAYLGAIGTVAAFVWYYEGIRAVGASRAFVWYYEGIRAVGASRAAIFINLVPIFGVSLSAIILSEPIFISMISGGSLAIAGVMLTNGYDIKRLLFFWKTRHYVRDEAGQKPLPQTPPSQE